MNIIDLGNGEFINGEAINCIICHPSKFEDYPDAYTVRMSGGHSITFSGEDTKLHRIWDWFAAQVAERLDTANDGDLQEIQSDAHRVNLPDYILAATRLRLRRDRGEF